MQTIEAYYDGRVFVPTKPVDVKINERAVVTILEGVTDTSLKRKGDKAYLNFAGVLSDENYDEIMEILKDTGQIDANEW